MAKQHKQDNIDADSDFSIDESSDEEKNVKNEDVKQLKIKSDGLSNTLEDKKVKYDKKISNENERIEQPKEKIDIWKKRTVGTVFEEALKRYYERKAARGC